MTKIGIVTGSTREGRVSRQVADYILDRANKLDIDGVEFEVVDIKDYPLPLLDSMPPAMLNKNYDLDEVTAWSKKIDSLDGFIFVTPEYNKAPAGVLKNHLDQLGSEWMGKAAGLVGYGSTLGVTAVQALRLILSNFNMPTVGPFGAFSLFTDFENMSEFKPAEVHNDTIDTVIKTTADWAQKLSPKA
ncbi:NADPH-dependent FMN reductase [Phocicoccus pinnipedialis]|uniref:NADPH-dependent FMN reductase n=1 Tax=Phocicoccus pinnipedialis TaxID=110845 RepID=A0A6V7R4G8_9BACL|nr:NAD(P)H-dependent oxidoreductase [Jeotgalicoccus pinnipedialis]MBP1940109.1 NAD(P)H-dependent FMN reductase [Jeotgalicoccus pinnipedialis]CAD2071943.1 NADPH-dependent FMN reductase [Jeotgalicoccus pinnipedialis]